MFHIFSGLRRLIKTKNIQTEGFVFKLHYRWTVLFLLASSMVLTCRQYLGNPIECLQNDVRQIRALETFCWIHSTFLLPNSWNGSIGDDVPHPGISNHVKGQNRIYHAYYQWVIFVLFFQAMLFYTPKYLWKSWENGTMKALSLNLHKPFLPEGDAKESIELLVYALHTHWGQFRFYAGKYLFCEVLNLVNVAIQIKFLNTFLGGAFTRFGLKVIQWSNWDQEYRTDPLVETFPRVTKCEFFEFGSSGTVQRRDALCILPLNILNEKIYIFLWFWLLVLLSVTALMLLFRAILFLSPSIRFLILMQKAVKVNKARLGELVTRSNLGDLFVLYLLAENIDADYYNSVIIGLTNYKHNQNVTSNEIEDLI